VSDAATLYLVGLAAATAAALVGALAPRSVRRVGAASLSSAGSLSALVGAGEVLLSGRPWTITVTNLIPFSGVDLRLDPLSALFVAVAATVAIAAAWYSIGYGAHAAPGRTAAAAMPAFLATVLLVPAAANVTTFMVAWELMALASLLALLAPQQDRPETRDAAQWYATMTHIGAAAILIGLVALATASGGQTFATIASAHNRLSAPLKAVVFVLVLTGLASKAGAVPLHVWLPRAHPEAPSPVSALMSGAMVNLGIYGILRVGMDLLGGGSLWWWLIVAALGVATAVFGALHAAASTDAKRLLAYSTVDNMGLVLIGVGATGALAAEGERLVAALLLLGALFHLTNHALFKGTLFLGAGAIQHATGTRDLDMLGGLARSMPLTAITFGVGALAISALPGLNGFTSEWLLLEGLLHGFVSSSVATEAVLLAGVAALAVAGGLTVAAFVKIIGVGLLGQPRSDRARAAHDPPFSMLAAMVLLAGACIVIGVAPGVVLPLIERAASAVLGAPPPTVLRPGTGLVLSSLHGAIEPGLLVVGLAAGILLLAVVRRLLPTPRQEHGPRRTPPWACGQDLPTARMEITATSFAEPLQHVFAEVLRPDRDLEITHVAESRYFLEAVSFTQRIDDGVERALYRPVIAAIGRWGRLVRRLPNGSVHRYLAVGFAALVVLLVVLG